MIFSRCFPASVRNLGILAVTYVFVDDPTHGYGLYIEWMLDAAKSMDEAA